MCWTTYNFISEIKTAENDIKVIKIARAYADPSWGWNEKLASSMFPKVKIFANFPEPWNADTMKIPEDAVVTEADAYFRNEFHYTTGKTYTDETDFDGMDSLVHDNGILSIWRAFHSYDPDKCSLKLVDDVPTCVKVSGPRTYMHYYSGYELNYYELNYRGGKHVNGAFYIPVIMHCVIPKGARYIENEYGEYVSDTIRVDGMEFPRKK